jgi:hypothetical protein
MIRGGKLRKIDIGDVTLIFYLLFPALFLTPVYMEEQKLSSLLHS